MRVEMPTNQPLVLLRELDGGRYLPIWIGAVEASAIAYAQQGTVTARPLTHELMQHIVEALGDELNEVQIIDVRDGIFYASLIFASGAEVEARPSDSIALALRVRGADPVRRGRARRGRHPGDDGRGRGDREVPRVPRRDQSGRLREAAAGGVSLKSYSRLRVAIP